METDKSIIDEQGAGNTPEFLQKCISELESELQKKNEILMSLHESEERFRTLVDSSNDGVSLLDLDGNILFASKRKAEILGYDSVEELVGMNAYLLLTPDESTRVKELNDELMMNGKIDSFGTELIRKDGKKVDVEINFRLIKDENNMPKYVMDSFRDITSKKTTLKELEETKMRMTNLLENLEGLIYSCDFYEDWTMKYLSNGCFKLTGYHPDEIVKNKTITYNEIIHPEDRNYVLREIDKAVTAQEVFTLEYRIVRKDKSVIWVLEKGCEVLESGNRQLEGFITDITERKILEEKLKTSYRIFNHSIDMLCIAGFDGYFKVLNPSWSRILGWTTEEILIKPWIEFVHPDDKENTENAKMTIVDGKEVYSFDNRYLCKDGSYKWLSWNSFPYPDEKIMFGVARDISKQRQTENDYQQIFNKMLNGFALHEIICNDKGEPADYRFLAANPAFEKLTGLKAEEIQGKTVLEILPGTEKYWIEKYGNVALTGEPEFFENFSSEINKFFEVTAYQHAEKQFACIFTDTTNKRKAEMKLKEQMEEMQRLHKHTIGRELKMIELKKEINDLLLNSGQKAKYKIVEIE